MEHEREGMEGLPAAAGEEGGRRRRERALSWIGEREKREKEKGESSVFLSLEKL